MCLFFSVLLYIQNSFVYSMTGLQHVNIYIYNHLHLFIYIYMYVYAPIYIYYVYTCIYYTYTYRCTYLNVFYSLISCHTVDLLYKHIYNRFFIIFHHCASYSTKCNYYIVCLSIIFNYSVFKMHFPNIIVFYIYIY